VAKELITRLQARAENFHAAGRPDGLAWFDLGYLAEAYKQWMGKGEPNPSRLRRIHLGKKGYRFAGG
jgi:hypothetical protein